MTNQAEFGVFVDESSQTGEEEFGVFADAEETSQGPSRIKDVAKQVPVSAAKGGLGAWGNLAEFLGIQSKNQGPTPGQQARYKMQSDILEKMNRGEKLSAGEILMLSDDDIAPEASRLPTTDDVSEMFEMLGINPEAETEIGRIVGKGVEGGAGAAAFGAGGPLAGLAALGGSAGETIRELGGPEWAATTTDLGISLGSGLKNLGKAAKGLAKKPQKTESGITKLKGVGKDLKKTVPVSEKKFAKASDVIKGDFKKEVERLTDKNLPFSRISKNDPRTYSRFDNAFKAVRNEAKKIPGKKFGGEELFGTIDESIKKARKIPYKSGETKGYLQEMNKFRKELAGNPLSASQWEQQYREINKGIRNLSSTVDVKGDKAGKLKALNELRDLTEKSIASNFKDNKEFVQGFKSLNKAYSDLKNFENVNKLFDPALDSKYFSPSRIVKKIDSPKGQKVLTKALGKEGYQEVQKLATDLNDVDDLFKMLNVKQGNWKGLAKKLGTHIPVSLLAMVFPKGAIPAEIALLTKEGVGQTRKILNNMMLSPQGRRNWGALKNAIKKQDAEAFKNIAAKLKRGDDDAEFGEFLEVAE